MVNIATDENYKTLIHTFTMKKNSFTLIPFRVFRYSLGENMTSGYYQHTYTYKGILIVYFFKHLVDTFIKNTG